MPHWPGNGVKMASHSNFKLKFWRPLDLVRDSLFEFDVNWEVWVLWVFIWLIIGHRKATNIRLIGQWRKNGVTQQLSTKIFRKAFRCSWRFLVSIWCDLKSLVSRSNHPVVNCSMPEKNWKSSIKSASIFLQWSLNILWRFIRKRRTVENKCKWVAKFACWNI